MDEYIDIVTREGKQTGKSALKSVIHQKGYYHNTVHIWFYTLKGEILLSQRSAKKIICPLLWDVSVAGHIDAGESILQAAIRETKEEIGLSISENQLNKIGVFECFQTYEHGITDNEFHHTFACKLHVFFDELTPQKEEVEALKLITLSEFNQLIESIELDNQHLVASNKLYYKTILQYIKNAIK